MRPTLHQRLDLSWTCSGPVHPNPPHLHLVGLCFPILWTRGRIMFSILACSWVLSCLVSASVQPHGLQPSRLLCPWNFPGKNTRVGCHFLLQGIFPTQGSNPLLPCSLHWKADSLPLSHLGSPFYFYCSFIYPH